MAKATAVSPANIAFIKYWGKKDSQLNIPFNDSISMNLSECTTTTTVAFDSEFNEDVVKVNGKIMEGDKKQRVVNILDRVRTMAGVKGKAEVISKNSFPTATGMASSASGFSALAMAASKAAGLGLDQKQLSILARLGSGSACRSVINGFAWWKAGKTNETSYAVQLAPVGFWELRDIVAVVSKEGKKISTTEGHEVATTSPYFKVRQKNLPQRINEMMGAFKTQDFRLFGELVEEEAIDLHVMAMTSKPPVYYWNEGTVEVMSKVREWREGGLESYYTMDAGANVHVICLQKNAKVIANKLENLANVERVIVNSPALGTKLV